MSGRVGFVSLGCPKALVDSERILTQLKIEGYSTVNDYAAADLVIINTCGFIESAIQESMDSIDEALKENGRVIVTGCLGKDAAKLEARFPEVLAVTGPQAYESVMKAVHQHLPPSHDPLIDLVPPQGIKLTPKHYAYLKISEGCNHKCTFCIIPDLRGKLVSRPIGEVMREAERLVAAGVKELLVISQDTSAYGVDLGYKLDMHRGQPMKTRFQDLVKHLGNLGIWVRLHYVYPYPHVDDIIPDMAEGRILPYLDIPFQHASHSILKAMRRPAHQEKVLERLTAWRKTCPDIAIRSTFIVGFPGESDQDFEELLAFMKEAQLDRVGCFTYSAVEGARANGLEGHISESLKQERLERFMMLQAEISALKLQKKVGKTFDVLVDEVDSNGCVGRTRHDAPEIDGVVMVNQLKAEVRPGDLIQVKIDSADEHDLFGHEVVS